MIKWKRTWMDVEGELRLVYVADEADWAAWSIDRVQLPGLVVWRSGAHVSARPRYAYQPKYYGTSEGDTHKRLREAKAFVERGGRPSELPQRRSDAARGAAGMLQEFGPMPDVVFTGLIGDGADMGMLTRVRDGLLEL